MDSNKNAIFAVDMKKTPKFLIMESIKNQEKFTLTEYEHDAYSMSANAEYGLINKKKSRIDLFY